MKVKGWMKVGENVSFFRSEKEAEMSSLLIEGYSLADNIQEFEFEVDCGGHHLHPGTGAHEDHERAEHA